MIRTHQTARARTVFSSEFETLDFPLVDFPLVDFPLVDFPLVDFPLVDFPLVYFPLVDRLPNRLDTLILRWALKNWSLKTVRSI